MNTQPNSSPIEKPRKNIALLQHAMLWLNSAPSAVLTPRQRIVASIVLPLLVFAIFISHLFLLSFNFPWYDDYESILQPLIRYKQDGNLFRLLFLPHFEHIIASTRFLSLAQWMIMGEIDFRWLMVLGNSTLLALILLWWKTFPRARNSWAILIASIILFNYYFWEGSLWTMASLSNFPVIIFAWAAILFNNRRDAYRETFGSALQTAACAVASGLFQANGLFIMPLLIVYNITQRRVRSVLILMLISPLSLGGYWLLHHVAFPGHTANHSGLANIIHQPIQVLDFAMHFLGSICNIPTLSFIIGVLLVYQILRLFIEKHLPEHHTTLLLALFIFASAFATANGRLQYGTTIAISSRYAIYPTILIMLLAGTYWVALAQNRMRLGLTMLAVAAGWLVILQITQAQMTHRAQRAVTAIQHKHHCSNDQFTNFTMAESVHLLDSARKLGIYTPPDATHVQRCMQLIKLDTLYLTNHESLPVGQSAIDAVEVIGKQVLITGWADGDASSRQNISLSSAHPAISVAAYAAERPDVAAALGRPDYLMSGFRIYLSYASEAEANEAGKTLCLAYDKQHTRFRIPRAHVAC